MLPSFPHLGKSQRSTQPECNGQASLWGNCLPDHSWPLSQVSMLEYGLCWKIVLTTVTNSFESLIVSTNKLKMFVLILLLTLEMFLPRWNCVQNFNWKTLLFWVKLDWTNKWLKASVLPSSGILSIKMIAVWMQRYWELECLLADAF